MDFEGKKYFEVLKNIDIDFIKLHDLEFENLEELEFLYFDKILPSNEKYNKIIADFSKNKNIPDEYNKIFRLVDKTRETFNSIDSIEKLKNFQKDIDKFYVYNQETFHIRFPYFDLTFYRNLYFKENREISDNKIMLHYLKEGIKNKYFYNDKYTFVFYGPLLWYECGGCVVPFNMAKFINDQNDPRYCARIFNIYNKKYKSEFFEDGNLITEEEINDNCIIIYNETVKGNPLNAKNVVRWILLDLKIEMGLEQMKTWGKNDLICNWESKNKETILRKHYIKKNYFDKKVERKYSCGLLKKGKLINKVKGCPSDFFDILLDKFCKFQFNKNYCDSIISMLFKNSINIDKNNFDDIMCDIFNRCKVFYTYDPHTMWVTYALLCGCPVVIIPPENYEKDDYFKGSIYNLNNEILNDGIGWGKEELEFAVKTVEKSKSNFLKIFKNEDNTSLSKINNILLTFFN